MEKQDQPAFKFSPHALTLTELLPFHHLRRKQTLFKQ